MSLSALENMKCGNPLCFKPAMSICNGCRDEIYCGSTCQKMHWSHHKALCRSILQDSNINSKQLLERQTDKLELFKKYNLEATNFFNAGAYDKAVDLFISSAHLSEECLQ